MVGWHHPLDQHEFEQVPGVGDGPGSLACCSPWGCKESDTTERLNNNPWKWYPSFFPYLSTPPNLLIRAYLLDVRIRFFFFQLNFFFNVLNLCLFRQKNIGWMPPPLFFLSSVDANFPAAHLLAVWLDTIFLTCFSLFPLVWRRDNNSTFRAELFLRSSLFSRCLMNS